nr:helix-turn-helix transcriptional regulator [uncultured Flavobacterium sp.]
MEKTNKISIEVLKIIALRKAAGKTQLQIANSIGMSRTNYNNLEKGIIPLKLDVLQKLCTFFNVHSSKILTF